VNRKQYKILAVDDNPKNIQVIGSILRKADYLVGFAFNGQQAIDLLNGSGNYDLVLLDVNMPEMNGYETCLHIRENEKLNDIPVIFLTALSEVENVVRGFDSGAQDYIVKPFNAPELLARVQTHVELKSSREKLRQANIWLEQKVKERTQELQKSNRELESLNKKLERANRELELLDEAKVDFLGIISHEINTPLNGIIGFTNILREELKNNELNEMLNFLDISAKRLEKFTKMSLLITELRTKRKNIYFQEIDLHLVLNGIIEGFKDQIRENDIHIVLQNNEQTLWGDLRLVTICFESLLNNALRFTPANRSILISVYSGGRFVICDFEDEGSGFPPKILKEPFRLFSYGQEHEDENKGLSLALIKLIMDAHQGDVRLANRKKGGALVRLYFKRRPA